MKLEINKDGSCLTIAIEGSIDTVTAPELEAALDERLDGADQLVLDFTAVDYVSSAGLRVVMNADRHMQSVGELILKNVNSDVREVFEMTGFDELLNFR